MMTRPVNLEALDNVSDRIGALYQRVGRLQHRLRLDDPEVTAIMDELVNLDEALCNATGRAQAWFGPPTSRSPAPAPSQE